MVQNSIYFGTKMMSASAASDAYFGIKMMSTSAGKFPTSHQFC